MKPEEQSVTVAVTPKQTEETERWSWVKPCAWTTRMLTALDKGVKGGKWFSLIDKIRSRKNLEAAFEAVLKNKGAPGVDHETVQQYEKNLEENLDRIEQQLRMGTYQPQLIRRKYIQKAGSAEMRPLGIPTVRDRTVQAAVKQVIEPIFERQFAECSYGFRPQRGCIGALREVDKLLKAGHTYVVDADIQGYFDTISHEKLMGLVEQHIADARVLGLVRQFLEQGVLEEMQEWTPDMGTPQGGVISPLLANIYLDGLDHEMTNTGYRMIRYADDLVVMCETQEQAEQAMARLKAWMDGAELKLHPTKTKIVDMTQRGAYFDFLGYRFVRTPKSNKLTRWPRPKSEKKLRESIRRYTHRNNGNSLECIIAKINQILCGWHRYFRHSRITALETVDGWVRMRLRSILRSRRKGRGCGRGSDHQRWPNVFFAEKGLFTMVTATKSARQSATR